MLQQFYPDHEADSAYGIDYKTLYRKGYRGIIFDIDNTLVPHGAPATPQAIEFFGRLRELGFQTLLLSNNKEPREGLLIFIRQASREETAICAPWSRCILRKILHFLWETSCSRMCGEPKNVAS